MVNPVTKIRQVGDIQADGTIYAGKSPTTGKSMYVAPSDSPSRLAFNEAARYAKGLRVGDKNDFRVPNTDELRVLADVKFTGAFRGTFKTETDEYYWSSESCCEGLYGKEVRIRDGYKDIAFNQETHYVRCIRFGL